MRTADQPIRISLIAPNGRMGKAIAAAAADDPSFRIDQDRATCSSIFRHRRRLQASLGTRVSLEFRSWSARRASMSNADERIAAAAEQVAVLSAANTSLGVALLSDLVERAARVLGPEWDIEITETHHRMKADAPSGTALAAGRGGRAWPRKRASRRARAARNRPSPQEGRDRFLLASRRNGRRRP